MVRVAALLAFALLGCAQRAPEPECRPCRARPPMGPFLTSCFPGSRPYDTDYGCSLRPAGPTLSLRYANEMADLRIDQVVVTVDDEVVFDTNLPLVLSRPRFPVATLAAAPRPPEVRVLVRITGVGRLVGYYFEVKSHRRPARSDADLSFTLYQKRDVPPEEAIALRWTEAGHAPAAFAPALP